MMENIFSDIAGRCVTVNTEKSTFPLPPAFLWSLLFVADKGNRTTQMFSLTYISSRRFFFFQSNFGSKGKENKNSGWIKVLRHMSVLKKTQNQQWIYPDHKSDTASASHHRTSTSSRNFKNKRENYTDHYVSWTHRFVGFTSRVKLTTLSLDGFGMLFCIHFVMAADQISLARQRWERDYRLDAGNERGSSAFQRCHGENQVHNNRGRQK